MSKKVSEWNMWKLMKNVFLLCFPLFPVVSRKKFRINDQLYQEKLHSTKNFATILLIRSVRKIHENIFWTKQNLHKLRWLLLHAVKKNIFFGCFLHTRLCLVIKISGEKKREWRDRSINANALHVDGEILIGAELRTRKNNCPQS